MFLRRTTWWSAETLAKAKKLMLPPVEPARRLGRAQMTVLKKLTEHPLPQGGWAYKSQVNTIRILETLKKYGLVRMADGAYLLTNSGLELSRSL